MRAYLERHAGLRIVGEVDGLAQARAWLERAASGEHGTTRPGLGNAASEHAPSEHAPSEPPELVILDLKLRDGAGTELIPDVHRLAPGARILILSSFPEEDAVRAAMRAGAHGWLDKQQDPSALADAVRASLRGELPMAAEAVRALSAPPRSDPFDALTPRERQVLDGIADGLSNREIAGRLGVREKTVKTHAGSIYTKLGVDRRTQAALLAREHGAAGPHGPGEDGPSDDGFGGRPRRLNAVRLRPWSQADARPRPDARQGRDDASFEAKEARHVLAPRRSSQNRPIHRHRARRPCRVACSRSLRKPRTRSPEATSPATSPAPGARSSSFFVSSPRCEEAGDRLDLLPSEAAPDRRLAPSGATGTAGVRRRPPKPRSREHVLLVRAALRARARQAVAVVSSCRRR
ncbi:MAG: response regulator transcription factor [Trueperaceae bacterium]|nr:response regulator transcription factor [Trueperaceae bacterium]